MSEVTALSVIEIGTCHEGRGDKSTQFLIAFCELHGLDFYTCDVDPTVAAYGKTLTPNAVCARGEDFLANFTGKPIVFAYLDNFDWCLLGAEGGYKLMQQAAHYRTVLGTERTNANSQSAHLEQAKVLLPKLHSTAFILFDDTYPTPGTDTYEGKGGTAIPFLLANGLRLIEQGDAARQYVLLGRGVPSNYEVIHHPAT